MKNHYLFLLSLCFLLIGTQQTKAAHVPVSNSSGYSLGNSTWGGFNWDDKTSTLSFTGIPDKLSFQYKYSSKNATQNDGLSFMFVEESADNRTWSTIWENSQPSTSAASSGQLQLQKSTRYVKFHYRGNFGATFSNISVTELKYVEDPEPASLDLGTAAINSGEVTGSVLVNWCNVSAMTVTSSSDRFIVTPSSFGAIDEYGSQLINIAYVHTNEVGNHDETITISNGTYTKYIPVHAETVRRPQTIIWNSDLAATGYAMNVGESYPDNTIAVIATTVNQGEVTFSSDNTSAISVSEDGKTLTAVAPGTANITATQAGDSEYQPAEDTKQFVVTNLLKQTITWDQNLLGLLTTSETDTLTATASSGGDITYTSADESVVTVSGNVLTVVGEGETYITATQAGGEINGQEYLSISQQMMVIVRNPASQCKGKALTVNGSLTLNSSKLEQVYNLTGTPDSLTFNAKHGTKSGTFIGFDPVYSAIIAEQFACINNLWDWYKVYEEVVGTSNTTVKRALHETATKIRFRTLETGTDHTVSSISVSRKKVLRANVEAIETEAEANAVWQKEITVTHSNIDLMTISATAPFTVSTATLGEGCGDFGDDKFVVSFTPTEKNQTYTGTVTITDGKATPATIEIPLTITSKGLNQSVLGFELPESCTPYETVTFSATATSGLPVTYTTSNENIAVVRNDTLVILGLGTVNVTAMQEGNEKYDMASVTKTIVINGIPVTLIEAPVAAEVEPGETLADAALTGGEASVAGTFAWENPETELETGEHTYNVIFTPTEAAFYEPLTLQVTVNVRYITWILTEPEASSLTAGQALALSELTGGEAEVEGTFAWESPETPVARGTNAYNVVFTPADAFIAEYRPVTFEVNVTAAGLEQSVTDFTMPDSCLATDLIVLSATATSSLPVTFTTSDENIAVVRGDTLVILAAGTVEVTAIQAGNDEYEPASVTATIVINKAQVSVTEAPVASEITAGQTLADAALIGGEAEVAGTFDWEDPTIVVTAGENKYNVVFTPADEFLAKYLPVTFELTITVKDNVTVSLDDINGQTGAVKFYRNGSLYIRRDGHTYTVTGAKVD